MSFCVDHGRYCLFHVCLIVNIDVTYTVEVFDHGDFGIRRDPLNQSLATTGDNYVDQLLQYHHFVNCTSVSGIDVLDHIGTESG